jgi:hypothetical protein
LIITHPNRHDTGSTTARSVDEVALIRDTVSHCAPVLIAQNSSRRHPWAGPNFFAAPEGFASVLFGERSLRRVLSEYVEHYHAERNHQGKDNVLLFPRDTDIRREQPVQCRERLGGLLRYYHQEAA